MSYLLKHTSKNVTLKPLFVLAYLIDSVNTNVTDIRVGNRLWEKKSLKENLNYQRK